MGKMEFMTTSKLLPDKLFNYILDFEYYPNYFPRQIKDVKIIKQDDNEIITTEKIAFSTIIKNIIEQKSLHKKISDDILVTEIIEGPAKGSTITIICKKIESGSEINFVTDLNLSLKAKFLEPLIRKFYKRYLTSLIFKINNRWMETPN